MLGFVQHIEGITSKRLLSMIKKDVNQHAVYKPV